MYRILIVEDDAKIAAMVAGYLERYGYQPFLVDDFRQVERDFLQVQPHLVLMDVSLPYQDGFHLTRTLGRHSRAPILFLSARTGEMEQVLGMESGGDDYMTKPFHLEVLHAKVKAMLRRAYGEYAQGVRDTPRGRAGLDWQRALSLGAACRLRSAARAGGSGEPGPGARRVGPPRGGERGTVQQHAAGGG